MTRTTLPAIVLAGCLVGTLAMAQIPSPPTVQLLGCPLALVPAPAVTDGVLVGPWGALARAAGLEATWDAGRGGLRLVSAARTVITLEPGETYGVDGQSRRLPVPATRAGQDLVAPLKPLCEAVGWTLEWDAARRVARLWGRVVSLTTRGDEAGVGVTVVTSARVAARVTPLTDPVRTVVDLPGILLGPEPPTNYVNLQGLTRLRAGQFSADPPVTRLVADLAGSGPRGNWRPASNGLGGSLIFGCLHGDEPVIARRQPRLLKLVASSTDPDCATVTATFSDPVQPVYDVLRKPYRVLLDLSGADVSAVPEVIESRVPFIEELRFLDQGRLVLAMKDLVPFTVQTLTDPDRVVVTFRRDRLAGKTVVVDAGHGGKDSGARGRKLLEKNINLDVARRTALGLLRMAARPILTRDGDYAVGLYERPRQANALQADLFVSIHCNAFKPDKGSGTQTYYCTPQSKALAVSMQDALWPALRRLDSGVHQARFCVIRETQIPAVLVELLFIDNQAEEMLLAQAAVRQEAANGICEGLRRYLEGTASVAPAPLTEPGEMRLPEEYGPGPGRGVGQ